MDVLLQSSLNMHFLFSPSLCCDLYIKVILSTTPASNTKTIAPHFHPDGKQQLYQKNNSLLIQLAAALLRPPPAGITVTTRTTAGALRC